MITVTRFLTLSATILAAVHTSVGQDRPNIVVILTDDQGYADISFNPDHPKEVSTPHMDALAREGVFFSQAYTSGSVCSPTRAGLMLGRYQQRVGVYTAGDGGRGFDPKIPIFPSFLPEEYRSMAIGKWHLGLDDDYPELKWHALNRGFDECYKFMGRGGHDYFKLRGVRGDQYAPIYRNKQRLKDGDYDGYLTTRLTDEAVAFIGRQKAKPFFLYLAYNAVHAPAQAPTEDIGHYQKAFPGLTPKRATLMAMLHHLDQGVGAVVGKLKEEGLWDNTLLFFLTDNGGAKAMEADNGTLRGYKGSLYEGGIRTPWIVSWPAKFEGGRVVDTPVISLDILPTALDALGVRPVAGPMFDGKSLLPLLTGETNDLQRPLYWNSGGARAEWAVRQGDWKIHGYRDVYQLHNLSSDPSETHNLAASNPAKARELFQLHETWLADMVASADTTKKSSPAFLPAGKANVLFIVCDDLNTHVSPAGYGPIRTPALEKLAAESLTFQRAYCQYPVCGPSRASFLSGLYPETTAVLNNSADIRQTRPDAGSMPQLFKDNGYWTASVGKVFHSPRQQPGDAVWNEQLLFENDELPLVAEARREFESVHGPVQIRKNRAAWKTRLQALSTQTRGQTPPGYGPTQLKDDQHKDGKNVRRIIEWLENESYGDKPFFIACGIQKPHVPFLAPQKYFDLYPPNRLRYQPSPADDWNDIPQRAMVKRYEAFGFELGRENDSLRREYTQAYHACVSFIDAQLGLLFETLKRRGLWDDTIILFTSDHGYHLGEHFMWGKVTLFEECARTPLIVRVPGLTPPGAVTQALVEHVDFVPTLIELCGLQNSGPIQGRSFVPILEDPASEGKEFAYTVVTRGNVLGRSIRTQRWRYAEWGAPEQAELYDLLNDRREHTNLARNPEFRTQVEEMSSLLREAQEHASSGSAAIP